MQQLNRNDRPYVRVSVTYTRQRRAKLVITALSIALSILFFLAIYAWSVHEYQSTLQHCQSVGFSLEQCRVIVGN